MMPTQSPLRLLASLALIACVLGTSGCKWLRGSSPYAESPENRPLEVPPDLTLPNTTQAMRVPELAARSAAFQVADSKASVWRRVGVALERIDGVSISERAEVAGAYNVGYQGESFLVRVGEEGGQSRVSAVSADGREATSAVATGLLGQLRQRLL
jgi:uncharacterized lipoprotein